MNKMAAASLPCSGELSMDQFKDIRPYHDDEVRPVLDALLANKAFIRSLAGFNFPRLNRFLPVLVRFLVRKKLNQQLGSITTIAQVQDIIALYMDKMIEKTAPRLTHSGLDKLDRNKSYLFISNHRDIAMDPAFVNYMLYHDDFDTVYIAIGDNLLKKPFVNDLMRLNKSFIVKRSLKGRELLQSSRHLSTYIHHCISTGNNVWIAQREGRAKDGCDRTDCALLKMLAMARKKEHGFRQALSDLHIVPVAISYEFDPCDRLKADELYQKAELGNYQKDEQSDLHSIVTGMIGYKGHVHVSFGKELQLENDDDEAAAKLIDEQIINNYLLHVSNYHALSLLQKEYPERVPVLPDLPVNVYDKNHPGVVELEKRLRETEPAIRPYLLLMYANPVISRYARINDCAKC
ncbi:MAG: 1-acyl-sn-glycerol-3-phosphate acyltransferase [Pseudomonadales bacterium]|nr:1-acyl-sn-glycerol-3-phosphate acyltransferase [Pseudomonadales bacterium]